MCLAMKIGNSGEMMKRTQVKNDNVCRTFCETARMFAGGSEAAKTSKTTIPA
jgi:hypothetical protein